jgi:hypothetical protein
MGTVEVETAIWKKLHDNRYDHVEQARRARDAQINLARAEEVIEEYYSEIDHLYAVIGKRAE